MCLELRISNVQSRGLQNMLAHGYLVAIQTVAGPGCSLTWSRTR